MTSRTPPDSRTPRYAHTIKTEYHVTCTRTYDACDCLTVSACCCDVTAPVRAAGDRRRDCLTVIACCCDVTAPVRAAGDRRRDEDHRDGEAAGAEQEHRRPAAGRPQDQVAAPHTRTTTLCMTITRLRHYTALQVLHCFCFVSGSLMFFACCLLRLAYISRVFYHRRHLAASSASSSSNTST